VLGRHQPADLELDPIGIAAVESLGGAVIGCPYERVFGKQCLRDFLERTQGVDLPGQVIKPDRLSACQRRAGARHLKQTEVMVVVRTWSLEKSSPRKSHHLAKPEDAFIERNASVKIGHIQDGMVETMNCHGPATPVPNR